VKFIVRPVTSVPNVVSKSVFMDNSSMNIIFNIADLHIINNLFVKSDFYT
jgi:hypothetical protein